MVLPLALLDSIRRLLLHHVAPLGVAMKWLTEDEVAALLERWESSNLPLKKWCSNAHTKQWLKDLLGDDITTEELYQIMLSLVNEEE